MAFATDCDTLRRRIGLLNFRKEALLDELAAVRKQLLALKTTYETCACSNSQLRSHPIIRKKVNDLQMQVSVCTNYSDSRVLHNLSDVIQRIKNSILDTGACLSFVLLCIQIICIVL